MRYLDDISSLSALTFLACCFPELRTVPSEVCPFPIENDIVGGGGGGGGANTFSMENGQISLAHNSCTQRANAIDII